MKNLKLTTKIVAAFSLVVILFIATLIIFFNSLNNSNKGLSEYQSFSNNVITINSIKEDFYESYLIATDYFEVPDQNKANNFNDILENSVKTIKDNNINIDDVKNELISYKANFNNIVELQNKKQNYIDVDFKNLINQFDKKINEFKKAAEDKNDYSLGYYADSTIEIVPELIKYTNTYFQKSNSNNLELAKNEIQKLESQILMIKMGVSKELKQYYDDLNTIYENINNKFTDIINISNEQTPIIEQIQSQKNKLVSLINDKQNYFTNQQSSLENNLVSKNKNSLFITLLISGISIIIIIIASFYISLTIKKKISEMNKKINSFKNGDLNTNFKNNSNDEFGFMSSNLQNMADTLKNSFLNIFDISSNIDKTANELTNISVINNSISNEINSKTTMISSNSDEVKEEFIKITNSIEEISNASYNISDIANDLNQKATNATNSAKDGVNSISNITKKINTAVKTSLETEGNINELVQHSEKVKEILNTIDNITEQTSLLALNAAIEAARAGEAGKGFAVVADEIRKLAEGSKKSTEQISNILIKISNSTKSVSTASESNVNSVKDIEKEIKSIKIQFKGIMNDIELMNSEIENMASSSEEQSANLESINESMKTVQSSVSNISDQIKEIDTSIDKMADGAHKTSNNADLLSKYSENLINYIKYFKFQ